MSALAERIEAEKLLQKECREVEKASILRKLTRQHPAGMSAYSLWAELFERRGDVGHVAGLLEELAEARLVAASGGCWYAGAKVPASGIAPRAKPEPVAAVATPELGEEASAAGGGLEEPSPLWFSTRLIAALDAGHAAARIAERAVELGGYPSEALRSVQPLISAIRTRRTRGTSSIYRPGIELALSEIGYGRDSEPAPGGPGLPSDALVAPEPAGSAAEGDTRPEADAGVSQPARPAPCTEEEENGVPRDRGEEPRRDPDQTGGGAGEPRAADLGSQDDPAGGRPGTEAARSGLPGERGGGPERAEDVPLEPAGREVEDGGREPGAEGLQRARLIVEVGGNLDTEIARTRETLAPLARLSALDEAARVIAEARALVVREAELAQELEQLRARVASLFHLATEQQVELERLRGLREAALRALGGDS